MHIRILAELTHVSALSYCLISADIPRENLLFVYVNFHCLLAVAPPSSRIQNSPNQISTSKNVSIIRKRRTQIETFFNLSCTSLREA